MDPKKIIREEDTYLDKDGAVITDENKAWSIERTIVYADGTKEVWKRSPGQDPEKFGVIVSRGTDKDQTDRWDKQQPSATSQASAGRDTVNVDGRTKQWNPETKRYDIDVGSATDPDTKARQQAADTRAQNTEDRANRTEDRAIAAGERQAAAQEESNKRGWAELALQQQREQRLSEVETAKLRNGEVVRQPDGRYIQIRNGPDGKAIIEDVTPASSSRPGSAPTLPPGTHLGTISTALQSVAQRIVDDPNMTPQEKNNSLDQLAKFGTTFTQETSTILGAQQNIYTNESNQRSLNVRDAESRRNFSSGLINDAMKDTMALKTPVGSNLAGPAFVARLMLGLTLADKLGGLKTIPDVEMGQALQQTKGLGLPGMQPQQPVQQPQVQAQPQAGGMPTINIINGVPQQAPQSVETMMPPNPIRAATPPIGRDSWEPDPQAYETAPAWAQSLFG